MKAGCFVLLSGVQTTIVWFYPQGRLVDSSFTSLYYPFPFCFVPFAFFIILSHTRTFAPVPVFLFSSCVVNYPNT